MATPPIFSVGQTLTASQMNAVGLWKISSTVITNQAQLTLNNIFSSDFSNYKVQIFGLSSSAGTFNWQLRLRASGTNSATANYFAGYNYTTYAGATAGYGDNSATGWNMSYITNTAGDLSFFDIDFFRPQLATMTTFRMQGLAPDSMRIGSGVHNLSNSYDGFQIIPTGGTLSDN